MPREATFTDTMQGLLKYVWAFKEDYSLLFVDVRILNITDDIMSSNNFLLQTTCGPKHATSDLARWWPSRKLCFLCLSSWAETLRLQKLWLRRILLTKAFTFRMRWTSFSWLRRLTRSSKTTTSLPVPCKGLLRAREWETLWISYYSVGTN